MADAESRRRWGETQRRCDATYYGDLVMLNLEDDMNLQLEPSYLGYLGPEKCVVLFELLQCEYGCAYEDCLADDGSFLIPLELMAKCTGLRVSRVVRIMEQLSDLPPSDRSKVRYGLIHVLERKPEEWRIVVNLRPEPT